MREEARTLVYEEEGEFVMENRVKMGVRRKYVYRLLNKDCGVEAEGEQGDEKTAEGKRDGEYVAVHFFDDAAGSKNANAANGLGKNVHGLGDLFVEMGEVRSTSTSQDEKDGAREVWEAKNKETHLCAEDLYTASWRFSPGMARNTAEEGKEDDKEKVMWWEVRYDVKGPKKDYVSSTRYALTT